ncbi:hypothetical protein E9993_06690 [Labilibacter sediminis]|nr:hypothetical protein E9993_06690 [Labilibacter sediminis]
MMKSNFRILFSAVVSLLLLVVLACQKDEEAPALNPDAGPSFHNIENDGYFVELSAQEAVEEQTGTWRIYTGENGRFDDVNDPKTRFYGEPGEKYVLGWELSRGSDYEASQIDVSFKPLKPVLRTMVGDTLFNNRSLWLESDKPKFGASGLWEIVEGEGGRILNEETSKGEFIGLQNQEYTLRWSLIYGYKKESLEFTFVTDTLNAFAGDDELDIVTSGDNKFHTLDAFLPAGATAQWEIIKGQSGKVYNDDNANSLFEGVADTIYSLKWTVNLDGELSVDTVDVHFRGKWGVWTDLRDNQTYRFATINGLEWMAENYNYAYHPGVGSVYYGFADRAVINGGHVVETEEDRKFYGRLYTFEAAYYGAPEGWRLPTMVEYEDMLVALGGPLYADPKIKMDGDSGLDLNYPGYLQRYSNLDSYYRNVFESQGGYGYWWTSDVDDLTGFVTCYSIMAEGDLPGSVIINQSYSMSVRYVREVTK